VHQLFRVKVAVTLWVWRRVTRRVIVLLYLPHIGLDRGISSHRLVALGLKGLHGRIE
jgi:hypothetical protein